MKVKLFEFPILDFEEVYAIIDEKNKRLHISSVNYSYNITIDLTKDFNAELEEVTKWSERDLNQRVRKVARLIFEDLEIQQ